MTISEHNYQLLQVLRDYRTASQYREAYKILVLQYAQEIPESSLQNALAVVEQRPAPKFEKAEQELLDGNDPRTVLADFLKGQ